MIVFFFQAEDGIRDVAVTGVQTCALPICRTVHSGEDLIVALKELDALGIDVAGVMKIVDDRQVQAMESFIRSSDAISDFNDILNNSSGAAKNMSDIMENTLQGAVLRTKSAYEGFVLKLLE